MIKVSAENQIRIIYQVWSNVVQTLFSYRDYLKQPWPQLAPDKHPVAFSIVSNAVEDINRIVDLPVS
jgi:hypothetical protein